MLEMMGMISTMELLKKDVYTYVNYDELAEKAAKNGAVMKESKDFYGWRILEAFENTYKGKSQEDIAVAIRGMMAE